MPVFIYNGRTSGAKTVAGEIEAKDKQEAIAKLRQRKIVVAEVKSKPKEGSAD
jgi:type II secretory pathway component PulF